ncbi:MAG: transcription termination/antitermination protein NusG [Armatimonadota bacterium]|nr:transcription termination/antitermination protein NusG [Armatimonadota bacterium]
MAKQWYVVHTLTGKENRVKASIEKMAAAKDLSHLLGRILVPTETEIRSSGGQRREVKRKLYPGYVLIELDATDEMRQLITQTNGVTHFVGSSNEPVPLRPDEVKNILEVVGEESQKPKSVWSVGQSLRVTEGPFSEFTGKIIEVNPERETLKVLISIFGRDTPVELDFTQVEKL